MNPTLEAPKSGLAAVKQRQQLAWASGDYSAVGAPGSCSRPSSSATRPTCTPAGASSTSPRAAATRPSPPRGTAASRSASTTCPSLLERGRRRAAAEGLEVELLEGDAEALPFPKASFDAVTSVFGCNVRARSRPGGLRAATGLQARRHDRPGQLDAGGASSASSSWTIGAHVPPPAGVPSPMLWGN